MTRTHVDEAELREIGQDALDLFLELAEEETKARDTGHDRRADQVDAICEYIRHSRMLD